MTDLNKPCPSCGTAHRFQPDFVDQYRTRQDAMILLIAGCVVRDTLAEVLGLDPEAHDTDEFARLAAEEIKNLRAKLG